MRLLNRLFGMFRKKKINIQNKNGENDKIFIIVICIVSFIGFFGYFYNCLHREQGFQFDIYNKITQSLPENFTDIFSNIQNGDFSSLLEGLKENINLDDLNIHF